MISHFATEKDRSFYKHKLLNSAGVPIKTIEMVLLFGAIRPKEDTIVTE
jgi:hypothetical protein